MKRTSCQRLTAFTLIELLVVISIIALLIAMLLPVLGRAREQGNRVKCAANLHNWFLAISTYAEDNKGDYPDVTQWGTNDLFTDRTDFNGVPELAYKWRPQYGFDWEITQCPSRKQPRQGWSDKGYYQHGWFATDYYKFFGRADRPHSTKHAPVWPIDPTDDAYTYWGWTSSYWGWQQTFQSRDPVPNINRFRRSSKTVLAYDRSWTPSNPGVYYDYPGYDGESNHANGGGVGSPVWAEGANYMLLDGTVMWDNLQGSVALTGHDYYHWFVVGEKLLTP